MRVELFGIPRERAGVASLELEADTLGQVVAALGVRFPALRELLSAAERRSTVVANLNGEQFIHDPGTPISASDCVLILSADAGG